MTRKVTTSKSDETHETITVSQDGQADATIDIDITTPEGAIILQLLGQIDDLRLGLDANEPRTFTVRSGFGRDLTVELPRRAIGDTELVLSGRIELDPTGTWDALVPTYQFVWEDPSNRPLPGPKCCVTGNVCANLKQDGFRYCTECPGMSVKQLIEVGVAYPPGTLEAIERSEAN